MRSKKPKGFTLIELLVVIAIIGILASIVLVSFPGATKKAKDSRIISAIAQTRTVMTYIYANDGNYANFLCTDADMITLCAEVANNNPGEINPTIETCTDCAGPTGDEPGACIYSQLNAKASYWYCADSTGVAGFATSTPAAVGACDGTTTVCPALSG